MAALDGGKNSGVCPAATHPKFNAKDTFDTSHQRVLTYAERGYLSKSLRVHLFLPKRTTAYNYQGGCK